MKKLPYLNQTVLSCLQPKTLSRFFEIRNDGELAASLSFESKFGSRATATAADGTWTFKRIGFLNPHITIRNLGEEHDLGVYEPRFLGGGVLSLPKGLTLKWKPSGFWGNSWSFILSDQNALLAFKSGLEHNKLADMFKTQATIEISPIPYLRKYLTMLAAFGVYLIIMEQEESSTVAATAGAAVV